MIFNHFHQFHLLLLFQVCKAKIIKDKQICFWYALKELENSTFYSGNLCFQQEFLHVVIGNFVALGTSLMSQGWSQEAFATACCPCNENRFSLGKIITCGQGKWLIPCRFLWKHQALVLQWKLDIETWHSCADAQNGCLTSLVLLAAKAAQVLQPDWVRAVVVGNFGGLYLLYQVQLVGGQFVEITGIQNSPMAYPVAMVAITPH